MKRTIIIVFKKIKNKVIAIFPFEKWNRNSLELASYMHIGQHGGCDWSLPYELRNATPNEYAELLDELRGVYDNYNIKVAKRMPSREKILTEVL